MKVLFNIMNDEKPYKNQTVTTPPRKGSNVMWRRLKGDTNSEPQDFRVLDPPAPLHRFGTSRHYSLSFPLWKKKKKKSKPHLCSLFI